MQFKQPTIITAIVSTMPTPNGIIPKNPTPNTQIPAITRSVHCILSIVYLLSSVRGNCQSLPRTATRYHSTGAVRYLETEPILQTKVVHCTITMPIYPHVIRTLPLRKPRNSITYRHFLPVSGWFVEIIACRSNSRYSFTYLNHCRPMCTGRT